MSENIDLLNEVANAPEVLAEVAPAYLSVNLAAFFANPRNVMRGDGRGVVIFGQVAGDDYEMHYLFTHALRGRAALLEVKDALRFMFTTHGATAICGSVPRENRASRAMTRALRFRPVGTSTDSYGRPCINYRLERKAWATLSAES